MRGEMKIESNGFRITDICPQVLKIEVDGTSESRITVRPDSENFSTTTSYMSREEFAAFRDAVNAAWERMTGEEPPVSYPRKFIDRAGDVWEWRDDHEAYVIDPQDHTPECGQYRFDPTRATCGETLEWIKTNYGPVKILD